MLPADWQKHALPLLCDYFDLHGRWRAERPAVICGAERVTWGELNTRVHRIANGLRALGVGTGQRAAVLLDNRLETIEVLLGCLRSGAAVVPINLTINDQAIRAQLLDCAPAAIFATPGEAHRIDALGSSPELERCHLVAVGEERTGWVPFSGWRDSCSADRPASRPEADDLCTIIYSSGTTGLPKGIAHCHQSRTTFAQDGALAQRLHEDATTVCSLGFYSNATWLTMTSAYLVGGTVVVEPRFEPDQFLETVQRTAATHLFLVPLQYRMLLECPTRDRYDVSSLQTCLAAGAPMSAELKERVVQWMGCAFIEAYGLTEGFATILSDLDGRRKPASVGRPMPGADMKILRSDESEAGVCEPGEIVGWSRVIMDGYFNRPEETAAAFWTDAEGRRWLRTGDIGHVDEEGFLFLLERKKDMIISGGQNVYPIDIEAVASTHPDVAQVAVIGVPHERWGETPVAVVVPRDQEKADAGALMAWVNARVGARQRISAVVYRSSLPVNSLGKVLKRELRAQLGGK